MFSKVLVANRGEIAIRAFRAAYELGAETVAVFPYEDRNSEHRLKADEAYEIGERGHPVRAYLDPDGIVADGGPRRRRRGLPGLRLPLREPAARRGLRPRRHHVRRPERRGARRSPATRPARSRRRKAAGVPTLESVAAGHRRRRARRGGAGDATSRCSSRRSPAAAAAACGGSTTRQKLREAVETCMREAEGAFGDPTVFIEQAVVDPRHIEVQILADAEGNVIHLFERDCSVQRRHQKVVEIAPAPEPRPRPAGPDVRRRGALRPRDRLRQRRHRRVPARPRTARYVFIEMNPRIQVEHTVTEEVTDVDLVRAQMRIASGETLADLGLDQDVDPAARRRAAVPDHHRGPRQRLPPRHRRDHDVPLAGRRGHPARRRHDVHRCRGLRALRLDARPS